MSFEKIVAIVTLLLLILRFIDGFASKKETKSSVAALAASIGAHREDAKKLIVDQTSDLRETMKENSMKTERAIGEVLDQARKTNGRVTELERWQIETNAAKAALASIGGTAIPTSPRPAKKRSVR